MTFKIKNKPKKPERKTNIKEHLYTLYDIDSISVDTPIIDQYRENIEKDNERSFKVRGISLSDYRNLRIDREQDWYDDTTSYYITGERDESDKEYNERLTAYQKKLSKYNEWYQQNKGKIEETLKSRQEQEIKDKEEKKEREIKKLEQKLKRLKGV